MPSKPIITKSGDNYIIQDSSNVGYVSRMESTSYIDWQSTWDNDLNLISIVLDRIDVTGLLKGICKTDYDYKRTLMARNRHLKILKDYLGIEKIVPKAKNIKKIIWRSRFYNSDTRLHISELEETDKMFGRYRKNYMAYTDWTPEKEVLANEFNEAFDNLRKYENEVDNILFKR